MNHNRPIIIDALNCSNWDRELFEELHAGGVTCINVTCAVWETARETLNHMTQWYQFFRDHSDLLMHVQTGSDIEKAHAAGKTGVILGFQNASPIENDLSFVELFHRLGVRVIQLTYNNQNHIGSSCYEAHDSGLSRFALIQRDEEHPEKIAKLFYSKLPEKIKDLYVLLCDPMLATGGSAVKALEVLCDQYGCDPAKIIFANMITAPEGLRRVGEAYPTVKIVTACIDEKLNEHKFIVPGLGDAGDRIFNTTG